METPKRRVLHTLWDIEGIVEPHVAAVKIAVFCRGEGFERGGGTGGEADDQGQACYIRVCKLVCVSGNQSVF